MVRPAQGVGRSIAPALRSTGSFRRIALPSASLVIPARGCIACARSPPRSLALFASHRNHLPLGVEFHVECIALYRRGYRKFPFFLIHRDARD